MTKAKDRIVVALDGMDEATSLSLARELSGDVWGFKVNSLLLESGISIIEKLKAYGRVFADPKLHDIPNTVANGVKSIVNAGADIITIHASGGSEMITKALETAGEAKIICVTALTSLQDKDTKQVYGKSALETVKNLAQIAKNAKAHGIVCSPQELEQLAKVSEFKSLFKVVPGIRPESYNKSDDQSRIATPTSALEMGADLLVIGRPITQADNPVTAAKAIVKEIS